MSPEEAHIRELCECLLACQDTDAARRVAKELRATIHAHIEKLRTRLPFVPGHRFLPEGKSSRNISYRRQPN